MAIETTDWGWILKCESCNAVFVSRKRHSPGGYSLNIVLADSLCTYCGSGKPIFVRAKFELERNTHYSGRWIFRHADCDLTRLLAVILQDGTRLIPANVARATTKSYHYSMM